MGSVRQSRASAPLCRADLSGRKRMIARVVQTRKSLHVPAIAPTRVGGSNPPSFHLRGCSLGTRDGAKAVQRTRSWSSRTPHSGLKGQRRFGVVPGTSGTMAPLRCPVPGRLQAFMPLALAPTEAARWDRSRLDAKVADWCAPIVTTAADSRTRRQPQASNPRAPSPNPEAVDGIGRDPSRLRDRRCFCAHLAASTGARARAAFACNQAGLERTCGAMVPMVPGTKESPSPPSRRPRRSRLLADW